MPGGGCPSLFQLTTMCSNGVVAADGGSVKTCSYPQQYQAIEPSGFGISHVPSLWPLGSPVRAALVNSTPILLGFPLFLNSTNDRREPCPIGFAGPYSTFFRAATGLAVSKNSATITSRGTRKRNMTTILFLPSSLRCGNLAISRAVIKRRFSTATIKLRILSCYPEDKGSYHNIISKVMPAFSIPPPCPATRFPLFLETCYQNQRATIEGRA